MAVQSAFYTGNSLTSKTFPSTKHIGSKSNVSVWLRETGVHPYKWVQLGVEYFELINNSIVLDDEVNIIMYDGLEVRVADTPDELGTSLSDVGIVAGIANEITVVAGIANEVVEVISIEGDITTVSGISNEVTTVSAISQDIIDVADIDGKVVIVADNIADVVIDADNIADINTVADAIRNGGTAPTGGGQLLGDGLVKGVQYMSQDSSDTDSITIKSGNNGLIVDSFTLKAGATLTIEDNAVLKVV